MAELMGEGESGEEECKTPVSFWVLATGVVLLWISAFALAWFCLDAWDKRGQFGDLFGSVNALFSGLAFAGLIYAILLQRQELALQRTELRLQRKEMAASRAELASQVKAQNALVLATIAQVKVSALLGRIEAIKLEAQAQTAGFRGTHALNIREVSDQIDTLARQIGDEIAAPTPSTPPSDERTV